MSINHKVLYIHFDVMYSSICNAFYELVYAVTIRAATSVDFYLGVLLHFGFQSR